jgi:hypothetical protein
MESKRGIRISISEKSWRLILEALHYVIDKPHLDDLEESREKLKRIAGYIQSELEGR